MINKIIAPGGTALILSQPSNELDIPVNPPSDVTWGESAGLGSLSFDPNDPFNRNALFQSNGNQGVTVITMACQGISAQVSVTVAAPTPLPFHHFNPVFSETAQGVMQGEAKAAPQGLYKERG